MYGQVLSKPFVMFVGVPGSGKTATARHIALKLQEEDYDILSIKDIGDIATYCDAHKSQVFVIDDVLGKFSLDMNAYDLISRYKDNLLDATKNKTKVLLTCRQQVFRNHKLLEFFLCKKDHVVELSSDENVLTENDKCSMLELYGIERDNLPSTDLASTLNMFPLSCKLASTRRSEISLEVLISPICCILEELDGLKIRSPKQYASLVLLVANQNTLSEDMFDDEHKFMFGKRKEFLRECKLSSHTESFEVIDALFEMEGTYTTSCCDVFTFIHDTLFDIVAFHFGQHCPILMIRYMRSDYVAKYIKLKESPADEANDYSYDLCIRLDKTSQYKSLAERLYGDVVEGEWCCVFGNVALKHQSVLSFFMDLIKEKEYKDLRRVFLSELEENKRKCIETNKLDINDKESNLINIVNYLYEGGNQRAICWVIYYGHHEILEHIVNQILEKRGNVDDLYGNIFNEESSRNYEESASSNDDNDDLADDNGDLDSETVNEESSNDDKESASNNDDNDESADDDGNLDSDTKKVISEQHRLLLLSRLSDDTNTVDTVLDIITKYTSDIGKCTTYIKITYPGISYWCTIKRENVV